MSQTELNVIKKIAPGTHWALLAYPTSALLAEVLDSSLPYVLCWNHQVGSFRWEEFALPTIVSGLAEPVQSRVLRYDALFTTARFKELLPRLGPAIRAVQLASKPPDWLEMSRLRGKECWRVLGEIGWHVLLDTPGNDFGQVASPSREVVERAIAITSAVPRGPV